MIEDDSRKQFYEFRNKHLESRVYSVIDSSELYVLAYGMDDLMPLQPWYICKDALLECLGDETSDSISPGKLITVWGVERAPLSAEEKINGYIDPIDAITVSRKDPRA